jgi:hypothetical protein
LWFIVSVGKEFLYIIGLTIHVPMCNHVSLAMAEHLDEYHINLYRQVVKTLDKNKKIKNTVKKT